MSKIHKICYNYSYSFIIPPTSSRYFCLSGIGAYRDTKFRISFTSVKVLATAKQLDFLPLLLLSKLQDLRIREFSKKNSRIS